MKNFQFFSTTIIFLSVSFVISCSSGGGDDPPPSGNPVKDTILSGTAAAGAPVKGNITVKGANGRTATTTILIDGTYTVVFNNLEPPYILV